MQSAISLALVDCGDERKPCKYKTCVVVNGKVGEGMRHASSAFEVGFRQG